ncbi:MAG: class I SAM-dependent methyltransferase [Spirochaetaceae bacterium]|jgi:SAM-dependent methyltransferase|nr:class I SAM-dependent methyltransferase [Spirochaetaceae bacterium]
MEEDMLPWDYKNIVEKYFPGKETLLDMETGGGEFLVSLRNLPKNVYATESYEPNISIAKKRLKEKNIILKSIGEDGVIPFTDEYFDIIINRHGSYEIKELKRTLKKEGIFITQQVGGLNGIDINMVFETKTIEYVNWCMIKNIEMFEDNGMEILESGEKTGKMKFNDIGAFVYYLKCIPWQVEDFSINKYYRKLKIINQIIEKDGYINFIMHRFYIIIKKL